MPASLQRVRVMRNVFAIVFLAAAGSAAAAGDAVTLAPSQLDQLDALPTGATVLIEHFPDAFGGEAELRFKRIDVYAHGARVVEVSAVGERELPRSRRIQLIGTSADGRVRASLAFDPGFKNVRGVGSVAAGTFAVSVTRDGASATLRAQPIADILPAGVVPRISGDDDALPSGRAMPGALAIALAATQPRGSLRGAQVAVDTDNEFMSERFGNDSGAATNWIADLFGAMNLMYAADLGVLLQQGSTYLRTTPDPYTQGGSGASGAHLTEFGNYWQANYGSVPRDFALQLSGKSSNPNGASGIAWINAYCEFQSQGGSYSVNQVFTNAQIDVFYSALIVAHEVGHNFGAHHTHCTNAASGGSPTGTNTIDRCYSAEAGCYSGATSCPAAGPGAPAGTIMSYCNSIGCGPDGQNTLQFHPTHATVLSALIAQHTPSCLSPSVDLIFADGFD